MKALLVAGLVVSLAARAQSRADVQGHPLSPEPPAEAISFDAPRILVDPDGKPRWASDGGICLTPGGLEKIDDRLKQYEADKNAAVAKVDASVGQRANFFWGGMAVGGIVTTALAVGIAVFVIKR